MEAPRSTSKHQCAQAPDGLWPSAALASFVWVFFPFLRGGWARVPPSEHMHVMDREGGTLMYSGFVHA